MICSYFQCRVYPQRIVVSRYLQANADDLFNDTTVDETKLPMDSKLIHIEVSVIVRE